MAQRLIAICAALAVTACGTGEPRLMNIRSDSRSPDEFAILPSRPLEMPQGMAALPVPTPGGANRTDRQPEAEAIAALGGQAGAGRGADGALVATATRYGIEENIRGRLAGEDLVWRRENDGRLLERLAGVNVYYDAYRRQSLDQYAELERLRRSGIRTVAAPPDPGE